MKGYFAKFTNVEDSIEVSLYDNRGAQIENFEIDSESNTFGWLLSYNGMSHLVKFQSIDDSIASGQPIKLGGRNTLSELPKNNFPVTGSNTNSKLQDLRQLDSCKLADFEFPDEIFAPLQTHSFLDTYLTDFGGIVKGTVTVVAGAKGTGKTSNLVNLMLDIQNRNRDAKVLFISAEMSPLIIKLTLSKYYPKLETDLEMFFPIQYSRTGQLVQALQAILSKGYDFVVVDSAKELLSLLRAELGTSAAGAESWFLDLMDVHRDKALNERKRYTAFYIIQQLTKSGQPAGTERFAHMVDAVLILAKAKDNPRLKYMMFIKNRLGQIDLPLYYKWGKQGIEYDTVRYSEHLQVTELLEAGESEDLEKKDIGQWLAELEDESMENQEN